MADNINRYTYIINDSVEFSPQLNELKSLISEEDSVTLNAPVSGCLELLLIKHDQVVTQADFFNDVWEKNGTYVTLGTFYQNISLLRKSLKMVGLGDDVVITIPRKGLSVTKRTRIKKKISDEYIQEVQDEEGEKGEDCEENKTKKTSRLKVFITYVVLFILGAMPLLTINVNKNIIVTSLSRLPNDGDCKTYYFGITKKDKVLRALEDIRPDCSLWKYVYVNVHPYLPEASIVQCDQEINRARKVNCLIKSKIGNTNEY